VLRTAERSTPPGPTDSPKVFESTGEKWLSLLGLWRKKGSSVHHLSVKKIRGEGDELERL